MPSKTNRGLLTNREREFLEEGDTGGSNPRKIRQQIREHIPQVLSDLSLLFDEMENRDIEQIFSGDGELSSEVKGDYLRSIGFLYRLADITGADVESLIWEAIYLAHEFEHPEEILELNIQITTGSQNDIINQIRSKQEDGRPLTDLELRALFSNAFLLKDELNDLIKQNKYHNQRNAEQLIRDNPEIIEEDLEIIDKDLPQGDIDNQPDIIGQDSDENLVLINVVPWDITDPGFEKVDSEMENLIKEYGGNDMVRGIVVTISPIQEIPFRLKSSEVEYQSLYDHLAFDF